MKKGLKYFSVLFFTLIIVSPSLAANTRSVGEVDTNFPGGSEQLQQFIEKSYPYLEKYIGAPMNSGAISYKYVALGSNQTEFGQFPDTDEVVIGSGTIKASEASDNRKIGHLNETVIHELAHLFYDVGDRSLPFYKEQWQWEAHAEAPVRLALKDLSKSGDSETNPGGDGGAAMYDFIANMGGNVVSGVHQMSRKSSMSLMYMAADSPYIILTSATAPNYDFFSKLNQKLYDFSGGGQNPVAFDKYVEFLDEVLSGKTIDGQKPSDWYKSQPIAKVPGDAGIFLGIWPMAIDSMPRFEITFFERTAGSDPMEIGEKAIEGATVEVSLIDENQKEVAKTSVPSGQNTFGAVFDSQKFNVKTGIYKVRATAIYNGQSYQAENVAVVTSSQPQSDKILTQLVFTDENNNPAPENIANYFASQLKDEKVLSSENGLLVVDSSDKIGQEVSISFENFSKKITASIFGRTAIVKLPKELWSKIPETKAITSQSDQSTQTKTNKSSNNKISYVPPISPSEIRPNPKLTALTIVLFILSILSMAIYLIKKTRLIKIVFLIVISLMTVVLIGTGTVWIIDRKKAASLPQYDPDVPAGTTKLPNGDVEKHLVPPKEAKKKNGGDSNFVCPEYINCMPGPGLRTPCVIPPGCEGKTKIAQ